MRDLLSLPKDLPVPEDDGACHHLLGMNVPEIELRSTSGRTVNLGVETESPTVLFFYPRTGEPDKPAPDSWDLIPGARGCTPQSCGFRDSYDEFLDEKVKVFGVSSQTSEYQKEFVARMHIPFEILSDDRFHLTDKLKLPTFEFDSQKLIKRMALAINRRKIIRVFYPVFPPDKNAETVLRWIRTAKKAKVRPFASSQEHELVVDYFLNSSDSQLASMGVDRAKLPSRESWLDSIASDSTRELKDRERLWLMWTLDGKAVGHSSVNKIKFGDEALIHLHLWDSSLRKSGLGAEFFRLSAVHFAEQLRLKRLICEPRSSNEAPNRTLRKSGFRFVKAYRTTPGPINFEQEVNRYEIEASRLIQPLGPL